MKKIKLWYSVSNGGDGSAYPHFFLTEDHAYKDQEMMSEGWGEHCTGMVETFEGSNIHVEAKRRSKEMPKRIKAWENDEDYYG